MPTLIIVTPVSDPPEYETANKKAALRRPSCAILQTSAFGILLAPPRFVQSHLLSFHLSRIAGNQPGFAQQWLEGRVELDQRARQPVTHGTGLPELAAS